MGLVIGSVTFRATVDALEAAQIIEEQEGLDVEIRQSDAGTTVFIAIPFEDDFERDESVKILSAIAPLGQPLNVRVLSDEEIARIRSRRQSTERSQREVTKEPERTRVAKEPEELPETQLTPKRTPEQIKRILEYRKSEAFRRSQRNYQQSAAGREAERRYEKTERGKERRQSYLTSEKAEQRRQEHQERQRRKRRLLKLEKSGLITEEERAELELLIQGRRGRFAITVDASEVEDPSLRAVLTFLEGNLRNPDEFTTQEAMTLLQNEGVVNASPLIDSLIINRFIQRTSEV
jgi:hypothetical protein